MAPNDRQSNFSKRCFLVLTAHIAIAAYSPYGSTEEIQQPENISMTITDRFGTAIDHKPGVSEHSSAYLINSSDIVELAITVASEKYPEAVVDLNAGDINLRSRSPLMGGTFSSYGIGATIRDRSNRFKLAVNRVRGDSLGYRDDMIGWSKQDYQVSTDAEVKLLDNNLLSWSAYGSWLDRRAPKRSFDDSLQGYDDHFRVGGIGTTISAFDERVDLNLNWARSEFRNMESSLKSQPVLSGKRSIDKNSVSGGAYRHNLNVNIWSGRIFNQFHTLEFSASEKKTTEQFMPTRIADDADTRQRTTGVALTHGSVRLSLKRVDYEKNLARETNRVAVDQTSYRADLTVNLARPNRNNALIPSRIGLSVLRSDTVTPTGEFYSDTPDTLAAIFYDQQSARDTLHAAWQNSKSSYFLSLSQSSINYTKNYFYPTARVTRHLSASYQRSIRRCRLAANVGVTHKSGQSFFSGKESLLSDYGFNASYLSKSGLEFILATSKNRSNLPDLEINDQMQTYMSNLSLSMDFSALLPDFLHLAREPVFELNWNKSKTRYDYGSMQYVSATQSAYLSVKFGF